MTDEVGPVEIRGTIAANGELHQIWVGYGWPTNRQLCSVGVSKAPDSSRSKSSIVSGVSVGRA